MRRALFVAVAALLLSACGTRENAALQREVDRLREERNKYAKIAEHLDAYKTEIVRLEDDLRRTHEMGGLYSHEKRVERAAALPGIVKITLPGAGWELSGSGKETLHRIRREAGTLAVDQITVDATGWKFRVPAYDYNGTPNNGTPSDAFGVEIPPPTPAPGRFTGARTRSLRAEIESLQKDIAELEKLVGDVRSFETKKAELTAHLDLIVLPSRLAAQQRLMWALFIEDGAPCVTGKLTLSRETVRLFCAPRGKDHDASATAIRALFPPNGDWRVGPVSIDERAPEPLQVSLTHRSSPLR